MATFLARALKLPASSRNYFRDDDASFHEDAINRLARAGITQGCARGRFCPDQVVTRAQMAAFLARALKLRPLHDDGPAFGDTEGSFHEDAINRLARAGITQGCAPGRFCPDQAVTRAQMATFLARALKLPASSRNYFRDDRGLVPRRRHQPARQSGHHPGLRPGAVLPRPGGDPGPDGHVPGESAQTAGLVAELFPRR